MAKKTEKKQANKRPPIITIMGHVDHGKTTLMDYIQSSNIAQKEVGGITQSIRAFSVDHNANQLTFIDTPGHEAFAKMRERGSKLSDIVLLVVAADDGVKPQTKEVINLALRDKIPMVVAINKIDLPGADINRVKMELSNAGVLLEGWGGDVVAVEISAKTGKGIDNLLDMLELVSELEDLTYDEHVNKGIVLESHLQKNAGPESMIIVKSGTFEVGDYVVGDNFYGKIRALLDYDNSRLKEAPVSSPVQVLGLEKVLQSGEEVFVGKDRAALEELSHVNAVEVAEEINNIQDGGKVRTAVDLLDELMKQSKEEDEKPKLNIVLKADYTGSLEAIASSLENGVTGNVDVNIIKTGTGEITESDIIYAKSSKAVVISFNAPFSSRMKAIAQKEKVIVMNYSIIYELIDDVVSAAESLIPPEIIEVFVGSADIIDVFKLSNGSYVAGSIVKDGKIVRGYNCYVQRGKEKVFEGKITSIRRFKDEVKEVLKGNDCGISVSPNFEFLKGDRIFCIRIEKS